MEVIEDRMGRATMLRVVGRVDSSVAKQLEAKVADVIARDGDIVVDLHEMNYVSSAGLRSFIMLAKHAHAKNHAISLCAMREEVTEIFEISGLLELFAVHDSVETALAQLPR
jgi:anti-anti-sigma factor